MSSAHQPLSLEHVEAQDRAALLDVTAYDVALDLDRGDETFGSVSTITVRSQGGPTFVEVQPVTLNAVTVNGEGVTPWLTVRPLTSCPAVSSVVG